MKPAHAPKFETITINQLSALTLELEQGDYNISFENDMKNFYIDYFVLLPSEYFETTFLEQSVEQACTDYRNEERCIQYKYLNLDQYPHAILADNSIFDMNIVEIDFIKKFKYSYPSPLMAKKVTSDMPVNQYFHLPDDREYVLLVDFMNLHEDGELLHLEIDDDQTSVANGNVYLYKCNLTTFCREVMLNGANDGLPMVIKASDYSKPDLTFVLTTANKNAIVYKLTLVPKESFHINHIKPAPHCVIKNGQCHDIEFQPLISTKIELDENEVVRGMPFVDYLQSRRMTFLNKYNKDVTVPVSTVTPAESDSQMIIVTYYQPNHPMVNISVEVDFVHKGFLKAPYCPSVSGCRAIVVFGEDEEEVFENNAIQAVRFMHEGRRDDEIWIDFFEIVAPENVDEERLRARVSVKLTSDFIGKCASNHFQIEHGREEFCDKSVISMSAKYNQGALPCECNAEGSVNTGKSFFLKRFTYWMDGSFL